MKRLLPFLALALVAALPARAALNVLVEAESFANPGGWVLDTQFIEIMGSPYLMAHGMGAPVKDATTTVKLPSAGAWRVFVRTKDWVARWKAPGTPGKFQLLVNGQPLKETFGTKGEDWFWQYGGKVEVTGAEVKLALHDLTGFNGRCDAILFTKDENFVPPNDGAPLAKWRRELLGLPEKPIETGPFDVVVVGGGYGGLGAAISAARMGCKVALIQNRPVLGGNGSSEIRVWAMGGTRRGLYPELGEIVEEFMDRAKASPGTFEEFGDAKKEEIVRAEKNITLFLNTHAYAVEVSADKKRIVAVTGFNTMTGEVRRFAGRLFVDSTGHATIGALAGADHTTKEEGHLGMSNMWRWKIGDAPAPFPDVPWALDMTMDDFPYPKKNKRVNGKLEDELAAPWFWESGFDKHPLTDLEYTRDWNLRAIFGAFNAMKNKDGKAEHPNAQLEWVAYIGGTRESRQLLGDVVLTRDDIESKKPFPDGTVPTTWDIDLHYPKEEFAKKFPNDPFISIAKMDKKVDREHGYPVPYRCFYSRNLENLFMAGRDVSVTHEALGTVRVMKTGGMIGEVVGKAASLCLIYKCNPRDIYYDHFDELKKLMQLRGVARRDTVDSPIYIPAGAKELPPSAVSSVTIASLKGIVVDDAQAKLTGKWTAGAGLPGYIGAGYRYAGKNSGATARFEFTVPETGIYEVRFAYQPHENRAANAPVTVHSADGARALTVNEKEVPVIPPTFVSLGKYKFESGKPGAVEVTTEKANGNVHIDAVWVLKAE
ncbi:MAG: FAD-dependent oxidoreductase [Verrucomicrobia bacterium]|nr:FAD-dependent oxidoreductase [Verrucomicrobiota bacterium]